MFSDDCSETVFCSLPWQTLARGAASPVHGWSFQTRLLLIHQYSNTWSDVREVPVRPYNLIALIKQLNDSLRTSPWFFFFSHVIFSWGSVCAVFGTKYFSPWSKATNTEPPSPVGYFSEGGTLRAVLPCIFTFGDFIFLCIPFSITKPVNVCGR